MAQERSVRNATGTRRVAVLTVVVLIVVVAVGVAACIPATAWARWRILLV